MEEFIGSSSHVFFSVSSYPLIFSLFLNLSLSVSQSLSFSQFFSLSKSDSKWTALDPKRPGKMSHAVNTTRSKAVLKRGLPASRFLSRREEKKHLLVDLRGCLFDIVFVTVYIGLQNGQILWLEPW